MTWDGTQVSQTISKHSTQLDQWASICKKKKKKKKELRLI